MSGSVDVAPLVHYWRQRALGAEARIVALRKELVTLKAKSDRFQDDATEERTRE